MIKKFINRKSILYKPYLYFKILWLDKYFTSKKSYSQCGEDKLITNFFFKRKIFNGIYLDIGAYNPIKYNNTFLLFKSGWSGINIDLNQTSIDLFNILRPKDKNICAAISDKKERVKVFIENIFSPLNTISKDQSIKLKNINNKKKFYIIKTKTISSIVKNQFDFLNIDVEGMDFRVLKSINLRKYKPSLICIEILDKKNVLHVKNYLKRLDYLYIKKLGPSYFFKKN